MFRISKLMGHLTFIAVVAILWICLANHNQTLVVDVMAVLGSLHLGVVAHKNWPEGCDDEDTSYHYSELPG